MNTAYTLLAITVLSTLFIGDRKVGIFGICAAIIAALFDGIINPFGLVWLGIFAIAAHLYFNTKKYKILTTIGIFGFIAAFAFHLLPGFFNTLALDGIRLSEQSRPFSMYLNFDKCIMALIIYVISDLQKAEKTLDIKSIKQTLCMLALCVLAILMPALFSGYVKFDPKIPDVLFIWVISNFIFTCFAEEVVFRGFIQRTLSSTLKLSPIFAILITSILFGLAHFKGGVTYVILASVCGLFYGFAYYKTKRILCSMIVHFGLNLVHLLVFTYPISV